MTNRDRCVDYDKQSRRIQRKIARCLAIRREQKAAAKAAKKGGV